MSAAALLIGCQSFMTSRNSSTPQRNINAVLAEHDKRLLAISGVVGVYVGLLPDGHTPCLKVMLAARTPELDHHIPHSLAGYQVVTEVTGEIHPLRNP